MWFLCPKGFLTMPYNKENYSRIREQYETKYKIAEDQAAQRKEELHARFPELAEIDAALSKTGLAVFKASMEGKDGLAERIAKIREENAALRSARAEFLRMHGFPEDYTDVKYECEACGDSGFIDGKMCECMRKKLILAGYESSGIANLMKEQDFDTFSLKYYSQKPDTAEKMKYVFETVKNYAENFSADKCENLLFLGGTGLGKTHLSTAAAKRIIERGFDVRYVSALKLISDFEDKKFKNGEVSSNASSEVESYFDCDLLIIDDLGCEVSNQFTVSSIYDIINTRINRKKSTIISTNLTQNDLRTRYWDRITSRLLGEYRVLVFTGTDIRAQKLL